MFCFVTTPGSGSGIWVSYGKVGKENSEWSLGAFVVPDERLPTTAQDVRKTDDCNARQVMVTDDGNARKVVVTDDGNARQVMVTDDGNARQEMVTDDGNALLVLDTITDKL